MQYTVKKTVERIGNNQKNNSLLRTSFKGIFCVLRFVTGGRF